MKKYIVKTVSNPKNITVSVPGSKSITNRAFLLAALANGQSVLSGVLESDDTKYMQKALAQLGVKIKKENDKFFIEGVGGNFSLGEKKLFLGNAGTAVRFLTAAMILRPDRTIVTGIERMQKRPIKDLLTGIEQLDVKIKSNNGCPPVGIFGQKIRKSEIIMDGSNSSQYFSALMQIAPCLENGLTINVKGDLVSKPYIDITIKVMEKFDVKVKNYDYKKFEITPQKYQAKEYLIEGDASSASYWFGLAAITGNTVTVKNLSYDAIQGDVHFVDVMEKMGCKIEKLNQGLKITGPQKLKSLGKINMNKMPDAAMTLAVVAACAEGETIIEDVANMRIKETDRINALVTEMKKINIICKEKSDGIYIKGNSDLSKYKGAEIETYDDHRMAMCFAVLGSRVPGTVILDPSCTSKTYPTFFEEWDKI